MKKLSYLTLLLFIVLVFASCGAAPFDKSTGDSANSMAYDPEMAKEETLFLGMDSNTSNVIYDEAAPLAVLGESGGAGSAAQDMPEIEPEPSGGFAPDVERKLIRTGYYTMETLEFDSSIAAIEALVSATGGYIEAGHSSGGNGAYDRGYKSLRYAEYTVRIPTGDFFSFTDGLENCGSILNSTMNVQEVTDYYYDISARLTSLRIQEERLNTLISQATTLEAIIALESSLSEVRYNIESNEGIIRRLDTQIAYSTITITINEVTQPTAPESDSLGARISRQFGSSKYRITEAAKDFIVWLFGNILEIAIFVVFAVIVIIIVRRVIKKKKTPREIKAPEKPAEENKANKPD